MKSKVDYSDSFLVDEAMKKVAQSTPARPPDRTAEDKKKKMLPKSLNMRTNSSPDMEIIEIPNPTQPNATTNREMIPGKYIFNEDPHMKALMEEKKRKHKLIVACSQGNTGGLYGSSAIEGAL